MVGEHMQDRAAAEVVPACLREQRAWSAGTQTDQHLGGPQPAGEVGQQVLPEANKDKRKILHRGQMILAKASGCTSALIQPLTFSANFDPALGVTIWV